MCGRTVQDEVHNQYAILSMNYSCAAAALEGSYI